MCFDFLVFIFLFLSFNADIKVNTAVMESQFISLYPPVVLILNMKATF